MGAVLTIARVSVVRLLRERSNLFFVFVFPMMLVLLIGLSFGGAGETRISVVGDGDDLAVQRLVEALDDDPALSGLLVEQRDLALDALSRGRTSGVLVVPDGFEASLVQGARTDVGLSLRPEAQGLRPAIEAALAEVVDGHRAAALAQSLGVPAAATESLADGPVPPAIEIATRAVGDDEFAEFAGLGQFDLGASTQLILFIFITTLSSATRVVEAREFGVTRRMLAGPISSGTVVMGEGLGRFLVAMLQAGWVLVGSILLFSVSFGDPLGAAVVIASFGLAAAGAGLLLGAVAKNVNQAGGLGTLFGLTLAALGGCMAPLDIFSDGLRRVAHVTPHAWANDAFADLTRRDAGLVDVLPDVAVLVGFGLFFGLLAARRLQVTITRA